MSSDFRCQTFGKWILAGEHAVLRGCPALVFPVRSNGLTLTYKITDEPLRVEFTGERGEELRLLFWGVVENAIETLGHNLSELRGHMVVASALPVGAGLGASAALCVAVARWCAWQGWLNSEDPAIYEFSRSLENLFHGESSGVDIAVAMSGSGLRFSRQGERLNLQLRWQPKWFLSYSGQRGVTSECVNKVKALHARDPELGSELDQRMRRAVELAQHSLLEQNQELGFSGLVEAVAIARTCFEQWGLVQGELQQHMEFLTATGAVAVKPTGSGGGGFVLSLWSQDPPLSLMPQLLPLF